MVSSPTGVCLVARDTVQRDSGICASRNCSTKGAWRFEGVKATSEATAEAASMRAPVPAAETTFWARIGKERGVW
jgi:hypothetical protein